MITNVLLFCAAVCLPGPADTRPAERSSKANTGALAFRATGPDGKTLPRASWLYICDLHYVPVATLGDVEGRKIVGGLPRKPLLFSAFLEVPGFGRLDFTAANGGKGFVPDGQTLDVAYEVARHRALVAQAAMREAESQGYVFSTGLAEKLRKAECLLEEARAAEHGSAAQARLALASLAQSAPASEQMAIARGRQRLDRQGGLRPTQWVSTFALYEAREGERWRRAMDPVFNAAVQNWHWQIVMRPDGTRDWMFDGRSLDGTVKRLTAMNKQLRGVTGMWLNWLPDWHPEPTLANIRKIQVDFAKAVARRYPEIRNWQIVSEANGSWDNLGCLTPEQIVELSRAVSQATARVREAARSEINTNLIWSEDAALHLGEKPRIVCGYDSYRMLAEAGVPYECIVLQIYDTSRDLFELDQRIEQFRVFGKPIQLELAAPSSNEPQGPGCRHFPNGHPRQTIYRWHRPWDEELQADWLEGVFAVCMSKDYVAEFCWWDLADYEDCYFPWGGLVDHNYHPKAAYHRLRRIVQRWAQRVPGFGHP